MTLNWGKLRPFVFLAIVVVACARYLHGATAYYPLERWDETGYLLCGLNGNCAAAWAPIYGFFLKLIHLLTRDPIRTFELNILLQATGLALLGFALMIRLRADAFVSALLSICILLGIFNAPTFPKVNHLNTCAYLLALIVASFARNELRAHIGLAAFSLISVYLRTDNILIFVLLVCRLSWVVGRKSPRRAGAILAGAACGLFLVIQALGSPFGGDRIFFAFADHYDWQHGGVAATQAERIRQAFGDSHTLLGAALTNPRAFLGHSLGNLGQFLPRILAWPLLHPPLTRLSPWPEVSMIESLSLLGGLSLVFFRKRRSRSPAEKSPEAWLPRLVLFLCVCLLIKSAVTCAVLKPWHRYALEYLVLFFVVAAYLLRSVRLSQSPWAAVVAFGIALACPSHAHLPFTAEQMWPGQQNGSIREVVDFLRSNELKTRPVRLFSENAFAVYSGNLDFETWQSFEESPYRDRKDLRGFLSEKGVNILVVDAVMDFRLNELKANVADLGFRPLKTFGSGTRIYQWQESSTEPSR